MTARRVNYTTPTSSWKWPKYSHLIFRTGMSCFDSIGKSRQQTITRPRQCVSRPLTWMRQSKRCGRGLRITNRYSIGVLPIGTGTRLLMETCHDNRGAPGLVPDFPATDPGRAFNPFLRDIHLNNGCDWFTLSRPAGRTLVPISGEMAEWSKAHAWKVCKRQRFEGSNPSLSANQ